MAHDHRSERPARRGRIDDSGGDTEGGKKLYYHLTLLAENEVGYRNLIQLSSLAFLEGYYYKPRMDWELLERYHEGLIATTGCLGGHVLQSLLQGDEKGAARQGRPAAGDLRHGQPVRRAAGPRSGRPSARPTRSSSRSPKKIGAPLLATNDSHYTHREDHESHDALLCVQTGAPHLRPEAVQVRGPRALPQVGAGDALPVPRGARGVRQHAVDRRAGRARDHVRQRAAAELPDPRGVPDRQGLPRPPHVGRAPSSAGATSCPNDVVERVAYELKVINDMGFASYFLIVWDLIKHAKDQGIRVGPGRGSAAGCAVAYCLRITDLDPIKYDLLFERFLNPSRISMPDIDMDFDSRYRDEMIRYAADAVRPRPRRPDHHVRHDQGPQRRARRGSRARLPVRRRRQDRQGDAAARDGSRHAAQVLLRAERQVRRRLQGGRRAARDVRQRHRRQARRRRRQGARGPEALRRDPRRGRGDHQGTGHRLPADPAQARVRPGPGRRPDRHPVRDGRRRVARPAEDGLPRAAQPRRHHRHRRR